MFANRETLATAATRLGPRLRCIIRVGTAKNITNTRRQCLRIISYGYLFYALGMAVTGMAGCRGITVSGLS